MCAGTYLIADEIFCFSPDGPTTDTIIPLSLPLSHPDATYLEMQIAESKNQSEVFIVQNSDPNFPVSDIFLVGAAPPRNVSGVLPPMGRLLNGKSRLWLFAEKSTVGPTDDVVFVAVRLYGERKGGCRG